MDRYLLDQYVGKYRVKADYDLNTNDFIRDKDGTISSDYSDFYIDCFNNAQIRHVCPEPYKRNHELMYLIFNPNKGRNLLVKILEDYDKHFNSEGMSKEKLEKYCKHIDLFTSLEFTDGELYFTFTPDKMEYLKKFLKPKTNGASISPLSPRNLPKVQSIIPQEENERYSKLFTNISIEKLELAQTIKKLNSEFKQTLPKSYESDMKKARMKFKDYIYNKGLWEKYLKFIETSLKEVLK